MPDKDGFPTADEIIAGTAKPAPPKEVPVKPKLVGVGTPQTINAAVVDMSTLSQDQQKAVSLAISGMPFVMIAMRPTQNEGATKSDAASATGSDIYTAIHGDKDTLRGMKDQFEGVLERQYKKRGII